jgi:hypothetical protein
MPKRTGKLQKAIMEKLRPYPSLPILQNKLLWDLAFERDGVEKQGNIYGVENQIEDGARKKSFEINFRRAVGELSEDDRISITRRRLPELDEIIEQLPYLTDKLEVLTLRTLLLPIVRKYIIEANPAIRHRDFDPFGYQIRKLKRDNSEAYKELLIKWEEIEGRIVKILQNTASPRFDSWLDVLMWGRYYFRAAERKCLLKLPDTDTEKEHEVIANIKSLIHQVEPYIDFKVGNAKKVLYALFSAPRFGNTSLSDDLKRFLFKEKGELLRSLPGDEDSKLVVHGFGDSEYNFRNRKFSPLLDQLFTRHIFRELSFLSIPS